MNQNVVSQFFTIFTKATPIDHGPSLFNLPLSIKKNKVRKKTCGEIQIHNLPSNKDLIHVE